MKYPFRINELFSSEINTNELSDTHLKSALDLVDQKMIDVERMTTKSFMIDKATTAYEYIANNKDYLGIAISYFTNKNHGNIGELNIR